jgi:hypothetical protein
MPAIKTKLISVIFDNKFFIYLSSLLFKKGLIHLLDKLYEMQINWFLRSLEI